MKRNSRLMLVLVAMVSLLILVVVSFVLLLTSRVKKEYTVEVGQETSADVFRRYEWDKGAFIWIDEPDTSTVGVKKGKIQVFPITYPITLVVKDSGITEEFPTIPTETPGADDSPGILVDTTAPEVTTQQVIIYAEESNTITPKNFITEIKDESECTAEFNSQPDFNMYGKQTVRLTIKDSFGNSTEVEEELYIINLRKQLELELGSELPKPEDFLYSPGSSVSYVTDTNIINMMAEGNYEIAFLIDDIEAVAGLQISDTTAPNLVLKSVEGWLNKPLEPSAFIDYEKTTDNSDAFDTSFAAEPDWTLLGEQKVTVVATDASGNSASETATLLIKKDEKAPVVTVTDIDVKVGGTVSYKKAVSYYDDIDTKEEMKLSIERTGVNLKEVGTYKVTYTVTDCSGNSTSVTGKINVLEESPKWEDEEAIHKKGQDVLNSILKDGMTDREKAKAIYKWIKSNIGYINHSEKGNYIRGAYEGLFKKQGDCFVYAATAKELLTLAGIQNIDIVKATTNPSHYWNLVYIEDGWFHFDSTPRADKSEFFLLTDAELEEYSSSHRNTHIFDRSLYPEIK